MHNPPSRRLIRIHRQPVILRRIPLTCRRISHRTPLQSEHTTLTPNNPQPVPTIRPRQHHTRQTTTPARPNPSSFQTPPSTQARRSPQPHRAPQSPPPTALPTAPHTPKARLPHFQPHRTPKARLPHFQPRRAPRKPALPHFQTTPCTAKARPTALSNHTAHPKKPALPHFQPHRAQSLSPSSTDHPAQPPHSRPLGTMPRS